MKFRKLRSLFVLVVSISMLWNVDYVAMASQQAEGSAINNRAEEIVVPEAPGIINEKSVNSSLEKKGKKVVRELGEKRTRNSKQFLLSDGTVQYISSSTDIHYEDNRGSLRNINTELLDGAAIDVNKAPMSKTNAKRMKGNKDKTSAKNPESEYFRALEVPYEIQVPKNFNTGYRIGYGDDELTFIPVGAKASKGKLDLTTKDKVLYKDVWKQTDVELITTSSGIKENIYLNSDAAPDSFSFEVVGALANNLTAGELVLMPAWLQDKTGAKRDVTLTKRKSGNKIIVDVKWDNKGLVYPIVIDPTTTISMENAMYVDKAYPNTSYPYQSTMKVQGMSYYGYYNEKISLFKYNISAIPAGSQIISSSLDLGYASYNYNFYPYNSVGGYIDLVGYRLTSGWTISTTYNTRPAYTTDQASPVVRLTYRGQRLIFDLKSMTQLAVNNSNGQLNFGIYRYANDQIDEATFNGLASTMTINYSTSAPIVSTGSISKVNNIVNLSWQTHSENPQLKYQIIGMKNNLWQAYDSGIVSSSSSTHSVALANGTWSFAVRVLNSTTWGPWYIFNNNVSVVNNGIGVSYVYSNSLLKEIFNNTTGEKLILEYDLNGNLKKKVKDISHTQLITDGNPVEWTTRTRKIEDGYDDFLDTTLKQPERDIRSVYMESDSTNLYIMIELGRLQNYDTLLPHGYNDDNYFVYLGATSGTTALTRFGTSLASLNAYYEIASWGLNDTTVHEYKNGAWQWTWTGSAENNGFSSSRSFIDTGAAGKAFGVSAILELKIPLAKIPNANLSKVFVVAGSNTKDVDIASN
ncbi:hypothetical protein [Paenibacillus sp. MMS18-CY102]|uniref:hypothetical protein n=1 Tax=Paenibacillus sp. MMS18-CY102 TaxID=2682849 RepID=UPI001365A01D|nr:hypothetical protein [Paenibacillus sp. MMS18-CY102]MWC31237.1 hypothetical protein [Paenibacillus sp. MMS18-CY102]